MEARVTIIPDVPWFRPCDVARIFGTSRQRVHYWIREGKLTITTDHFSRPLVAREELLTFAREYLKLDIFTA